MCFIFSGVTPQSGQMLVVACTCWCRTVMVGRMLLMHFVMKCAIWKVLVSCARLKDVRSISSQSSLWVRLLLSHCLSIRRLYILSAIYWSMWSGLDLSVYICSEFRAGPIFLSPIYFLLLIRVEIPPWYVMQVHRVLGWEILMVLRLTPVYRYYSVCWCVP